MNLGVESQSQINVAESPGIASIGKKINNSDQNIREGAKLWASFLLGNAVFRSVGILQEKQSILNFFMLFNSLTGEEILSLIDVAKKTEFSSYIKIGELQAVDLDLIYRNSFLYIDQEKQFVLDKEKLKQKSHGIIFFIMEAYQSFYKSQKYKTYKYLSKVKREIAALRE